MQLDLGMSRRMERRRNLVISVTLAFITAFTAILYDAQRRIPPAGNILPITDNSDSVRESHESDEERLRIETAYQKLPIRFEAKQGQVDSSVQFLARGDGYNVFLTPAEVTVVLGRIEPTESPLPN